MVDREPPAWRAEEAERLEPLKAEIMEMMSRPATSGITFNYLLATAHTRRQNNGLEIESALDADLARALAALAEDNQVQLLSFPPDAERQPVTMITLVPQE